MKIIKAAIPFKPFKHECEECGAELLVEEPDIQYSYYNDIRDGDCSYFYAICASCESSFRINDAMVPTATAKKVKKQYGR